MTKRDFLRTELLKKLDEPLTLHGFKLNRQLAWYTRRNKGGCHQFQIVFVLRDGGWDVRPAVFIRVHQVEDIFHKTSGFEKKYQKGTPTIGLSLSSYLNEPNKYDYLLTKESQIDELASLYLDAFDKHVLPFYQKYDDLNILEKIVNADPYDIKFTGPIFKGSKGLILAKLTVRANYAELVKRYTRYYEELSNGFYASSFRSLVIDLENTIHK